MTINLPARNFLTDAEDLMDNSGLVLVAEQNPGLANALRLGFVLAGLKAITAASGQEALETLRQGAAANKPFFRNPGGSGLERHQRCGTD